MKEKYLWLAGKIKKGEIVMEGQRKTRLLLADDSITIRKVVEMTLPPDRFQITSVGDGEAALEALGNERPDVLLADVIMPKMDGYELCAVVRSSPEFKDIPVILLVGTFENYDEARGREAGADDYIVKPFETNDLIDKIQEVSARRAGAVEAAAAPPSTVVAGATEVFPGETASQETAGMEDVVLEYSDQVEFDGRKEAVGLADAGSAEGAVESFETLSDVPTHHEFCAEKEPAPACEAQFASVPDQDSVTTVAEETAEEAAAGDENFPWEEEIDLPEEEVPDSAEEHVFSLADFKPHVVEALEKGDEPVVPPVSEAEANVLLSSLAVPEEGVKAVPAEEPVSNAETERLSSLPPAPVLSIDSLQALQEMIEKSVHDAVLEAFGDFFREAVAKAAQEVVPALVEKAVREELDKQRG